MKLLPRILVTLAAPAGVLYGLTQIGNTPISKGYDMSFHWQAQGIGQTGGLVIRQFVSSLGETLSKMS